MANSDSIDNRPTSVYRYYDQHRVLIYVGVTSRGIARNVEHDKSKAWWPYVDRQEVDHYPTRQAALATEKRLIQAYHPPFNRQHNPGAVNLEAIYRSYADSAKDLRPLITMFRALNKQLPLQFIDWDGSRALFCTGQELAPLVECLERDRYGFKVGALLAGRVTLDRSGSVVFAKLTGVDAEKLGVIHARLKFLQHRPPTLHIMGVSIDRVNAR